MGEGLGELVLGGMDRCDDPIDDLFIASERLLPSMTAATNTTDGGGSGSAGDSATDVYNQQGIEAIEGTAATITSAEYLTHQPASASHSTLLLQTALFTSSDFTMKERFSLYILQQVFDIVVNILTNLAERRIICCDSQSTSLEEYGFRIISLLANSEYSILLNTYVYRIFIAKAGIRCKLAATIFLSRYGIKYFYLFLFLFYIDFCFSLLLYIMYTYIL